MGTKKNNIDLEKLGAAMEDMQKDPSKLKKVTKVEGDWNLGEGSQFKAEVSFEKGKIKLESDQPSFLGGGGTNPGPLIYCLYGSASCYIATFATMAAMEGVELKKLSIVAESFVDFSKVFGIAEKPIAEKVKFTLFVESDAPEEKIKQIEELANERCPAMYCLTQPIPVETELKIKG